MNISNKTWNNIKLHKSNKNELYNIEQIQPKFSRIIKVEEFELSNEVYFVDFTLYTGNIQENNKISDTLKVKINKGKISIPVTL